MPHSMSENELHRERSDLKSQGRFDEAILIQQQILKIALRRGFVQDIANGWNMLSHLQQQSGQLVEAEQSASKALDVYGDETTPRLETLATYEMKLAMILANQQRFAEAVRHGQLALQHFSEFHDPPDDFLKSMTGQVARWIETHDEAW